jgi:hypothetical protein
VQIFVAIKISSICDTIFSFVWWLGVFVALALKGIKKAILKKKKKTVHTFRIHIICLFIDCGLYYGILTADMKNHFRTYIGNQMSFYDIFKICKKTQITKNLILGKTIFFTFFFS